MAYDEKTTEHIRRLLRGRRNVTEQPLMGGICFMVNGNMCCAVSGRGGLLVRVGPEAHAQMVHEPHSGPMEMGGRIMKGYVRVAPDGYRTEGMLKKWLARGVEFAATLPGKTAKKAKRPAAKATRAKKPAKAPTQARRKSAGS
ncbi:TfoX/Sxy family protein [Bradyrhizobium sp.]|uniref:TfoX/Sxy family protein n=1 Tax=Bradyrhizobium sp. TaxID=376 RepID=UPI002616CA65|nr:TfoX/Sxy family protein [Bradyrhizobium sp.]